MRINALIKTLRFFVLFFFLLALTSIFASKVNASVTYSPAKDAIDETDFKVEITFDNLVPGKQYALCPTSNTKDCLSNFELLKNSLGTVTVKSDGTVPTIPVCGQGYDKVKILRDCEKGKDYFRGGNTYVLSLVALDTRYIISAPFFVKYYFPEVKIINASFTPGVPISISVSQGELRAGSEEHDDRNEYKATLKSVVRDFELNSEYVKISQPNTPITLTVPKISDAGQLDPDTYFLYIKGGADNEGVIFYQATVTVDSSDGQISDFIKNENLDVEDEADFLPPPPPPCATLGQFGQCVAVDTAVGQIQTTPEGFVKSIFSLILGLAGGLALLLIIYSGFQLVTSRGIPEKLEGAREQLVSAIIGLVFIILSLTILQIIGVDILKIPGFGR